MTECLKCGFNDEDHGCTCPTLLVVGNIVHYFDGYIPHPEENAIRLYRNKSDLDYIPPMKIKGDMLSDFGKEILKTESELRE